MSTVLWGEGENRTENPKRNPAHSRVRDQEQECPGSGFTTGPITFLHPSRPGSAVWPVGSRQDRTTCSQIPKQQPVHAMWGRSDGVQANGQVYKVPVDLQILSLTAALQWGCLAIPGSQAYALLNTVFISEDSMEHHPKRKGCMGRFLSVTHRTHPSYCATDIWDWGHTTASKSNPQRSDGKQHNAAR